MPKEETKALSAQTLEEEPNHRTLWYNPTLKILAKNLQAKNSGYLVHDLELLKLEFLAKAGPTSLIRNAAHPMSPFKVQGLNQELLDALNLALLIKRGCRPLSQWSKDGIRESVLTVFESEILEHSATKVNESTAAAQVLHSEIVLYEGYEPRGQSLKKKDAYT